MTLPDDSVDRHLHRGMLVRNEEELIESPILSSRCEEEPVTMEKIGRFTKQDIRELCPSLSISSIEGALRKLVAAGELKREGAGKNICYYRLK